MSDGRRRQLDFLDLRRHTLHLDPGTGPLQRGAVFFRTCCIQVVLDHNAPPGKQQGNTLRVGLEQFGQIGFNQLQLRPRHQFTGKGNLVTPHSHTPVLIGTQYGAGFFTLTTRCSQALACYTEASFGV
ncbi:hypothetical protein FQZ97_1048610 [compost metagenome]